MTTRIDRILTTHVGSLPRPKDVLAVLFAQDKGEEVNPQHFDTTMRTAVTQAVRQQRDVGLDVVNDGEMSKISYATYIKDRLTGFAGDTPREPGQDLIEFPRILQRLAALGSTAQYTRPRCVGPIGTRSLEPLRADLDNLRGAARASERAEAFMNAASPGVIALFQPNDFYPTEDAYLEAVAEAMRNEYEGIVADGILLQIDAPDLAMGRHTMYRDRSVEEFLRRAERHIEVLNHALRFIPPERVRMHVCWGNYEAPHHHDVPLELLLPVVVKARVQALLIEAANPRHAHEWTVFREQKLPDDRILIPGVIATTTNYLEHPLLVAERLCRFADVVGRERVIAGTDCGFGTFAGYGPVDPDVAYLKLQALTEGARIATDRLWRRS